VKNVPINCSDQQLAALFSRFGPVRSVRVKRPHIDISRPLFGGTAAYAIAYINFEKEEDAAKAIKEMNGKQEMGHVLQVELYDRSQQMHVFFS
jgi:RNA recognition motif-containing protein